MDEAQILSVAQKPHAWTAFITSDTSPARLSDVLDVLQAHQRENDVLRARAAHVMMLLGNPDSAVSHLIGCTHRMCKAQRLLALVQLGVLTSEPRQFVIVTEHPDHFGSAINPLEIEAQMRLDYAMFQAHARLGSDHAARYGDRAIHLSRMVDCTFMTAAVANVATAAEIERDPHGHAGRLTALALQVYQDGNLPLALDLARNARAALFRANAYPDLILLAEQTQAMFPEAAAWADAARTILDPSLPPPADMPTGDPLYLLAAAFHHTAGAARAYARLDMDEAAERAAQVLALPAWPQSPQVIPAEVAYRTMRVLCHMYARQLREATLALRDVVRDQLHHSSRAAAVYVGGAALALSGAGAAYLPEYPPVQAYADATSAIHRLPYEMAHTVMGRLAIVAPTALVILAAAPEIPGSVSDVASSVAVLTTNGLRLGGRYVPEAPRKPASTLHEFAVKGSTLSSQIRVNIHRYKTALDKSGARGVAFQWEVDRVQAALARHIPVQLTPRSA